MALGEQPARLCHPCECLEGQAGNEGVSKRDVARSVGEGALVLDTTCLLKDMARVSVTQQ